MSATGRSPVGSPARRAARRRPCQAGNASQDHKRRPAACHPSAPPRSPCSKPLARRPQHGKAPNVFTDRQTNRPILASISGRAAPRQAHRTRVATNRPAHRRRRQLPEFRRRLCDESFSIPARASIIMRRSATRAPASRCSPGPWRPTITSFRTSSPKDMSRAATRRNCAAASARRSCFQPSLSRRFTPISSICSRRIATTRNCFGPVGPYHSALAVFAFRKGLTLTEANALFNRNVFEALGYFDIWNDAAREFLETARQKFGMDLSAELMSWARRGVFMYSQRASSTVRARRYREAAVRSGRTKGPGRQYGFLCDRRSRAQRDFSDLSFDRRIVRRARRLSVQIAESPCFGRRRGLPDAAAISVLLL